MDLRKTSIQLENVTTSFLWEHIPVTTVYNVARILKGFSKALSARKLTQSQIFLNRSNVAAL